MALYAAEYHTQISSEEAWTRVSATVLRRKLIQTTTSTFVGIQSESDAIAVLNDVIERYNNVLGGTATLKEGGLWEVVITFVNEITIDPAQTKAG